MKFAINRYRVDFHVPDGDTPPLPGASLEGHPFGFPPREVRPIWIVEIDDLASLLPLTQTMGVSFNISQSGYWSGTSLEAPGERLYGIGLVDDINWQPDPRDRPIAVGSGPGPDLSADDRAVMEQFLSIVQKHAQPE